MKKRTRVFFYIIYWLLQWTWGIIQNLAGLFILLVFGRGKSRMTGGAVVRRWNMNGSMSLGMFILLDKRHGADVLRHEWVHTVQSVILGPLFLFAVGLPSVLWAGLPAFERYRVRRQYPYDKLYCESWATRLGAHSPAGVSEPVPDIVIPSRPVSRL